MNDYKYIRMLACGEREWEWRIGIKWNKKHKSKSPGALCGPVMMMLRTDSTLHSQAWQQNNTYKIVKLVASVKSLRFFN